MYTCIHRHVYSFRQSRVAVHTAVILCVCVCVAHTRAHVHVYVCPRVCVCVCLRLRARRRMNGISRCACGSACFFLFVRACARRHACTRVCVVNYVIQIDHMCFLMMNNFININIISISHVYIYFGNSRLVRAGLIIKL